MNKQTKILNLATISRKDARVVSMLEELEGTRETVREHWSQPFSALGKPPTGQDPDNTVAEPGTEGPHWSKHFVASGAKPGGGKPGCAKRL